MLNKNLGKLLAIIAVYILFRISLIIFIFIPLLRYALDALALLPLFAGYVISNLLGQTNGKFKKYLIAFVLVILISFNSIYWDAFILKESTSDQLRKWVDKNLAASEPIIITTRRYVSYAPAAWPSSIVRSFQPGYYQRLASLLGNSFPYNVRNIIYLESFPGQTKKDKLEKALKVFPANYYIDVYYELGDRFINENSHLKLKMVAHFSPSGDIIYNKRIPEAFADSGHFFPLFIIDRAGPYFDVLKLK